MSERLTPWTLLVLATAGGPWSSPISWLWVETDGRERLRLETTCALVERYPVGSEYRAAWSRGSPGIFFRRGGLGAPLE